MYGKKKFPSAEKGKEAMEYAKKSTVKKPVKKKK